MGVNENPALFGLNKSNRDFSKKDNWGKNQFNSSFPAALACYMHSKGLKAVFLKLDKSSKVYHSQISFDELFGTSPSSDNIFFAFESIFISYGQMLIGNTPRIDLVTQDLKQGTCLKGLEIKLTALPDNTTCELDDSQYGSEIVIRPDTIVYLACSLCEEYKEKIDILNKILTQDICSEINWGEERDILPIIPKMAKNLNNLILNQRSYEIPLILQPIWKSQGKSPKLANNCLDCFVWGNLAFTQFILEYAKPENEIKRITRQLRTLIWVYRMLYDFSIYGQFDHAKIIDELSYNTKNDKAFAASGLVTHRFMKSEELEKPRVTKQEIQNIILGGGQNLLSPERRFDAIIFNTPSLFD